MLPPTRAVLSVPFRDEILWDEINKTIGVLRSLSNRDPVVV